MKENMEEYKHLRNRSICMKSPYKTIPKHPGLAEILAAGGGPGKDITNRVLDQGV